MPNLTHREWREPDAQLLAEVLRPCDLDLLMATHGFASAAELLVHSVETSAWARTILLAGRVIGVFGIGTTEDKTVGLPWLLVSQEIESVPVQFVREARAFVRDARKQFPVLVNFESAANTVHLRWLRALGFQIAAEPEPFGLGGLPFYRFWLN